MENQNSEQESLPKPQTDLPLPEKDLPLPEKELPSHSGPAFQGVALEPQSLRSYGRKFPIPKYVFLAIVFVILLAILGGAYYLGKNSVYKELNPTSPSIPPPDEPVYEGSPTPTSSPSADISTWKTYNNVDYSIQYPAEFIIAGSASERNIANKTGDFNLVIATEPTNSGLNNYVDQESWCTSIKSASGKAYPIDSENSLRFEKNPCGQAGSTDIYIVHNGTAYHLSIATQETYEQNLPTLNQILSTFKFTR